MTASRVDAISEAVCRGEMTGCHEVVELLAYIRKIQKAITVDASGRIDFGSEPVDPDRIAALLVDGKWVDAEVVRRAARHLGMADQIIAQEQRAELGATKRALRIACEDLLVKSEQIKLLEGRITSLATLPEEEFDAACGPENGTQVQFGIRAGFAAGWKYSVQKLIGTKK